MSDWRFGAACIDEDPELFFPIGNTGPAIPQTAAAKAVCRACEVRDACLSWAVDTGQDSGVWGGLAEDERRALKRRNRRADRLGVPRPEMSAGTVRRRHSGGGPLVDAGPLVKALRELPVSGRELGALSRVVNPDAPVDDTTFTELRAGTRLRVFEGTRSRVQAVIDAAVELLETQHAVREAVAS